MMLAKLGLSLINRFPGRIAETQLISIIISVLAAVLASLALILSLPGLIRGTRWRGGIWARPSGQVVDDDLRGYYEVLGLQPGAARSEIKAAYRELVKRYHPDRLPYNIHPSVRREMEERLKMVNEAYKALTIQTTTPKLGLSVFSSELDEVVRYIQESERSLRRPDGAADSLNYVHSAAEGLVQTLHRALSGDQAGRHYYDMLSDLLMEDIIGLEEFELLSNIRRKWSDLRRGQCPSNREIAVLTRSLNNTYAGIIRRFMA
jgi:hypothetical protein